LILREGPRRRIQVGDIVGVAEKGLLPVVTALGDVVRRASDHDAGRPLVPYMFPPSTT
jgi:hypothetical protein